MDCGEVQAANLPTWQLLSVPADFCPIPGNTGPTLPDIPIFFREARNLDFDRKSPNF